MEVGLFHTPILLLLFEKTPTCALYIAVPREGLLQVPYQNIRPETVQHLKRYILKDKAFLIHNIEELPYAKHIFSHIEWHMTGFAVDVQLLPGNSSDIREDEAEYYSRDKVGRKPQWTWADHHELKTKYALPSAFRYFMEFLPGTGYGHSETEGGANGTDR